MTSTLANLHHGKQPVSPPVAPKVPLGHPAPPILLGPLENATVDGMPPTVAPASLQLRHRLIALTFVLGVLLPPFFAAAYLWGFAQDQYHSKVGFSVRLEENSPALGILAGLTGISSSSSSDSDILFEFIQSQRLVEQMNTEVDLREIWSRPSTDPIFALKKDASIEDLVSYWNTMVHLTRGKSPGLLEVEVRAFSAQEAHDIAQLLFQKSSDMINQLSAIAREDSIRYAREDLEQAREKLKAAREAVTLFRNMNQLVNPELDLQTQAGLLGNLQSQQAQTLIEIDLLRDSARAGDPRISQAERKLEVIEARIRAERQKMGFGSGDATQSAMANLIGEYERLAVEREFAERTYTSALASFDMAVAEARRQSRYLAAYMEPTMAETPLYPRRLTLLITFTMFLFLGWSVAVLIYYAAKDRR